MARRLIIDDNPFAFKLSKPGIDAEGANYDDLYFDISLGRMSGVWMRGSFLRTAMSLVNTGTNAGGAFGTYRYVLSYGRTFSVAPQVFVWCRDPALANDGHLMPVYNKMVYDGNTSSNTGTRSSELTWTSGSTSATIDLLYININYTLPTIFYYVVLRI